MICKEYGFAGIANPECDDEFIALSSIRPRFMDVYFKEQL